MALSRRDFGRMALSSLMVAPFSRTLARASSDPSERKFLFIFARGGWDPSYVFAPLFDNSWVYTDPEATTAELNGIPFVDAESRPAVRSFFDLYGDRACVINGFEVRSITHSVCTRLLFTGTSSVEADDFGSILAANSSEDLLLPHMILSGPSYGYRYSSQMVRMGPEGQLTDLMDGTCLTQQSPSGALPDAVLESITQSYLRDRVSQAAEEQASGWNERVRQRHARSIENLAGLESGGYNLSLGSSSLSGQISDAIRLFSLGLSRCVTVQHEGLFDMGWDSHATINHQSDHFQLYFEIVNDAMASLDATLSPSGRPLSEEVTVVLFSEMGRDPRINGQMGKHHWTHTSAVLVGAGVSGGQVIGEFDQDVTSSPIDLISGGVDAAGTDLGPGNIGATLLALGDVDPGVYLGESEPILAAIR